MRSWTIVAVLATAISLFALATPVLAQRYEQPTPGLPDEYGTVWETPFYDPQSKSYFELRWSHDPKDVYTGFNYERADRDARSLSFKGVQGRLAVVNSVEVHEFLLKTFHPRENVLIGLRYWCKTKQLESSDGKMLTPNSFQAWDEKWDQDNMVPNCLKNPDPGNLYFEVEYTPIQEHFRWIVKGPQKQFFAYFLEFPTGHE